MRKIFLALTACLILTDMVSAQTATTSSPIVLGTSEKIKSTELGETRTLNIYVPKGYGTKSDTSRYPVIYLLDGGVDEDFIHVCGAVQFLTGIVDTIPKCIIIGIANTDRKRDMTFPTTIEKDKKDYPTTGGSSKFISFIEKELLPYVTKKYKTDGRNMIIGQSLGGLLATQILVEKPNLFDNYLIISPSLWWDNESLITKAAEQLKKQASGTRRVFIAVGAEGDKMVGDAKKLHQILMRIEQKNLHIQVLEMPEEDHLTIGHNAVYRGLEALFAK